MGMVGLGAMGTPMCENLMAAGYQLTVCDSHPGRVEAMVAKGATAAATPAEAASGVDAIVTMVPNDAVLKRIVAQAATTKPNENLLLMTAPVQCFVLDPVLTRSVGTVSV